MSFSGYYRYKSTGDPWIKQIPDSWEWARNKRVFRFVSRPVGDQSGDYQLLSLTLRGVVPRDLDGKGKYPAEFSAYQVVKPGNVVFCLFDVDETPRTVGLSFDEGMVTGAYCVADVVAHSDPRFVYYWYLNLDQRKGLRPYYTGLRKVVRPETFMNLEMALPSLAEQKSIAAFLDHETSKIDALIAEQQRLIELLKEKRQAVISHAVTKGLNPNAPMKDSGVEWLGEVPAHWRIGKFKWFTKTVSGGTPPSSQLNRYYDGDIPWLRSLDLNDGLVRDYEVSVTDSALLETSCRMVPKNSVLIAMYGGDGTIGKNGLLNFNAAINQALCAFLPNRSLIPEFLHRYIQFYRPYWMIGAESSRKDPNIGQERVGDHFIVIPPADEQSEVIRWLRGELEKMDGLIDIAAGLVKLLSERRSSLVSAAVTGKIDVRGWLPSESASPEPVLQAAEEAASYG